MNGLNDLYNLGKNLTDKIYHHRYDRFYPIFLDSLRDKNFNLLEIGVDNGKSIELWKRYFTFATIYGIDINISWSDSRTKILKLDQSKQKDLEFASKVIPKCRVIIDDGSHHPEHQLKTFLFLFDKLLEYGGIYIIEDIECNYWRSNSTIYGYSIGKPVLKEYFSDTIDIVNSEFSQKDNHLNISCVTMAHNCIIIMKKTAEEIEFCKRKYRFSSNL